MAGKRSWYRTVLGRFRSRWVQVCLVLITGGLVMGASLLLLAPKPRNKGPGGAAKDDAQFKYMHCDNCRMELPYKPEMEGHRCAKCQPPKVGYYVATRKSIRDGTDPNPWKWVNVSIGFESVAVLAAVVYLLYLPVRDPSTVWYIFDCPHCSQKLRFRQVSLGGAGMCSRCKRMVRFPDEGEAVPEDVYQQQELQAIERELNE